MYDGYIIYVIDCESTSLDVKEGDVIEISAIRLIPSDDSYNADQKTWYLKALNPKAITDEALRVNGHKREDILHQTQLGRETYLDPNQVVIDIEMWIMEDGVSSMDRIFAGQNPFFDIEALQELWKKVGSIDNFPFSLENNNRVIDTKQIVVLFDLCVGKRRQYYNLSNLVKNFGVKKGKAHRASEDTRMTADLLVKLLQPLKPIVKEHFSNCYSETDETS